MAVFAIYVLYSWLSRTPHIDVSMETEITGAVSDTNVGKFSKEIGTIGDVGVGNIQKAKYTHLNKARQVDREFGFEKLLHTTGNEWEVEKPFLNIFQPGFKCYITASRGKTKVETAVGRTSPKDAMLSGNVIIHILSPTSSDVKESFIYLDDIIFDSERSEFSTAGPVRFVTQNARMLGKGMELVYNGELDRLEFLRIFHLDNLRLRTSGPGLLSQTGHSSKNSDQMPESSSAQGDIAGLTGADSNVHAKPPAESVAEDSQKMKASSTAGQQAFGQPEKEGYRFVLRTNVVINTTEQVIFADEVVINNISSGKKPDKAKTAGAGDIEPNNVPGTSSGEVDKTGAVAGDDAVRQNVAAAEPPEANESPEQFGDVVVTCDSGIVVTPMDVSAAPDSYAKPQPGAVVTGDKRLKALADANERTTFVAERIDYDVPTGDTTASGLSELKFYVKDVLGAEPNQIAVPVRVVAHDKARFSPASNQVVFQGDCLCTMLRDSLGVRQKYTLSSPKITVDLSRNKAEKRSKSAVGMEHLTAAEGVKLATIKTAGGKLLGGIELKCPRFDYDVGQKLFVAAGQPSVIKVDNSNISKPSKKATKLSLQRQCYAFVRDFDTLKYYLATDQIVADAASHEILIDYFPIVRGRDIQQLSITSSHIEAGLMETPEKKTELSALGATGGITYQDEDKQFVGNRLFYDAGKSLITVHGDQVQPCYLNGALVDAIEYDLKADKVTTSITGAGALQLGR